jgi:oligogalacturonide transporter
MIFSTLGAIIAGLIPTIMIQNNTDPTQYFRVAILFAVIFTVSILITFFGTWENAKGVKKEPFIQSTIESFTVYRSRTYRMFILIFLCGQGAADFVTGLAVYYVDDVLNAYGGGNFTILMGVLLIAQFAGTILFGQIMQRTTKTTPILIGFPIRIAATLAMLLFSHEGANFTIILVLSFIVGLGMAASSTSIYAILPDMADVDELITGISRPGTCSGMATFIRKIATGLSSAVIGLMLGMIGYDEVAASSGMRQAASVQSGIAYIYIFVPVLLMVLTILVARKFPMQQKEFEIIKKEIARRKGEDHTETTEEEKKVCENVTGFAFDRLWNRDNAVRL